MPFIDQNLLNIDIVTNIPGGFFTAGDILSEK